MAFYTSGESSSKRAVDPIPKVIFENKSKFHGDGGAIFAGFYYTPEDNHYPGDLNQELVVQKIIKKQYRVGKLPWKSGEIHNNMLQKLKGIIAGYSNISSHGADQCSLFYTLERVGRWGSAFDRMQWRKNQLVGLFKSPALVRMAFTLPPPISQNYVLHREIIKRFTPEIYRWPINGQYLLSSYPEYLRSWIYNYNRICRKVSNRIHDRKKMMSNEDVRARQFATSLKDLIHDTLFSRGSFGLEMLGENNLQKILDTNDYAILGYLVTMEQYRNLLNEAVDRSYSL